jgi:hypothetical protein
MAIAKEKTCEDERGGRDTSSRAAWCESDQPFEVYRAGVECRFQPMIWILVAGNRLVLVGYMHWNLVTTSRGEGCR